jgi:hypothetical protein
MPLPPVLVGDVAMRRLTAPRGIHDRLATDQAHARSGAATTRADAATDARCTPYPGDRAVDERPRDLSLVGAASCAEPQAHDLHLPALRPATPCDQRAHAAPSRGRSESAPTCAHPLRCPGAQRGQAPHTGRVAQDQTTLAGRRQPAPPAPLASVPRTTPTNSRAVVQLAFLPKQATGGCTADEQAASSCGLWEVRLLSDQARR